MSTVRLASVTKHYGPTIAVHELDLDVADGELVTLLGPSGCGKTTTLRMVAGLIEPTAGRIWFDDQDVTFLPPRARNIGFVFQTPALFPHLSVSDNVAFGLSVKGRPKAAIRDRVAEMLAMVGLPEYGARMPAQMSGGQQQRVALARVLATDPRVLLFDEPLSALDRNLRDTLKYAILELQRRTGKTAIYVTHDQSEAFAISDRIVVMNGGRVEQIGTQMDIYLEPRTPFVAEFIGANNVIPGVVESVGAAGRGDAGSDAGGDASADAGGAAVDITMRADDLVLRGRGRGDLAVGDRVVAYLRPEDITVLDEGAPPTRANLLEADVERVIFEGPTVQLRVRVGDRPLRVDVGGGRRLSIANNAGKLRLEFDDLTIIPAAGATTAAVVVAGEPEPEPAQEAAP
jgi:ABC-type Fe3+/spermidine/putrescine transport system ATPase subunit